MVIHDCYKRRTGLTSHVAYSQRSHISTHAPNARAHSSTARHSRWGPARAGPRYRVTAEPVPPCTSLPPLTLCHTIAQAQSVLTAARGTSMRQPEVSALPSSHLSSYYLPPRRNRQHSLPLSSSLPLCLRRLDPTPQLRRSNR